MHEGFLEDPHLPVVDMIFTESRLLSWPSLCAEELMHESCWTRSLEPNIDINLTLLSLFDLKQAIVNVDDSVRGLEFPRRVALQSQTTHS